MEGGAGRRRAASAAAGESPAEEMYESPEPPEPPSPLDRAVTAFNASEYPRRVAGVARSLGAPEVNVRSAEHAASVVRILIGVCIVGIRPAFRAPWPAA